MLGQLSSLERASGAALSPVSILVSREVVVEALGPVQGLPAAPSKATDTAPVRLKLAPAKKAAGVGAVVNVDTLRDALAEDAIPDNLSESDSQAGMVNPHSVALTSRTAGSSAGRSTPPVGAGGAVLGVNGTASDHLSAPGSVGSLGSRKLGKPALSAEALNVLNALAPSPGAPQLRTRLGIPNGVVSATSLATTEEMELVMKKTTVQVQPVTIPNMEVSGSNGGRPPLMI
ncbi:hypothetical protein M427DRAFT_274377 [Gonapodya prolifera JEL478]|uniref:Uncharacterized protein n=1 Tax=Gonapodya prolifera (strain JEL478) TaxID=1344416 RepID=A0A139AXW3_GONPJ|nr:hypothetical protein M427DRAFT_274377 [Gonapodya prolifera JEL478]|eukprot:KXS21591.1 hypothetical protein M427DRAFT_274377 [Gonapodya prolifera JEL478]